MSSTGADVMRAVADALNARDFDRAEELLDSDLVFVDYAMGVTTEGAGGFLDYARGFFGAFSDMRLDALSYVGDERLAAGEFVGHGTHDGLLHTPTGEVPATGRRIEAQFVWYGEIRDGKLVRLGDYYNGMTLMTQLGLMPDPSAMTT